MMMRMIMMKLLVVMNLVMTIVMEMMMSMLVMTMARAVLGMHEIACVCGARAGDFCVNCLSIPLSITRPILSMPLYFLSMPRQNATKHVLQDI